MNKVLLVENDPIISSDINKLLSGFCQVHSTSTTDIALHLALANKYNAVLIDIDLRSSSTGISTANSIGNIKGYESIPIVAFMINKQTENKEFLLSRGYTHLIAEPYNTRNFAQQVKFILSQRLNNNDLSLEHKGKYSVSKIEN